MTPKAGHTFTAICYSCHTSFEPKPWQIKKQEFKCVVCNRRDTKLYRAKRKAAGWPVVSGKMPREYHRSYEQRYFENEENRARRNANMRAYSNAESTRPHHVARWKVHRAIEAGRLRKQLCEVCGSPDTQAHHDDYSRPLDVRWLCRVHHVEYHAAERAKATAGGAL